MIPLLFLFASAAAQASEPPALPAKTANNANDLQRAAWACESGGQYFERESKATSVPPRFFLSGADGGANQGDKPPLALQGDHLSGFGNLSNDKGWSNIRFDCTLSPDHGRATAFKYEALSPPPAGNSQPSQPSVAKSPDASKMNWYVNGASPIYLTHGVKETDNRDFASSCVKGSGEIKVALTNSVKWLKDGGYVTVGVSNGPSSGLYVTRGIMDENLGSFMPVFTITAQDPLTAWIAKGSSLLINIDHEFVYEVSLKGSGPAVKAFTASCRQ